MPPRQDQRTRSPSPADSSQDDDHEPEEPKKKRTRILTTPDQARELYALLAQSQFPSTAAREDIGRRIGLSARRVQVWFQNQRQKARRPKQGQGPGGAHDSTPTASTSSLPPPPHLPQHPQHPQHHLSRQPPRHLPPPSQLTGPGVPGPSFEHHPHPHHHHQSYNTYHSDEYPPRFAPQQSRHPIVLPPLGSSSSPATHPHPHALAGPARPPLPTGLHPGAPHSFPPPRTLEPQPQWSHSSYAYPNPRHHHPGQGQRYDPVREDYDPYHTDQPGPSGSSSSHKP